MTTNGNAALVCTTDALDIHTSGTGGTKLTSEGVWRVLEKSSFAVISHANAAGEPRSSGVVYGVADGRLYVAVAADGWKARQLVSGQEVAITVPVRRGGILALLVPIPPATITFHARATVHPAGSLDVGSISKGLARLVPEARKAGSCIIELAPEGTFLTYGIGVSLKDMADPGRALARVPVAS